jgi:hypothetical protein
MIKKVLLLASITAVQMAVGGELTAISTQFVAAATRGDAEGVVSTLCENGVGKEEMITEFKNAAPDFKSGKLKFTKIERELVIGDLGVTLMRLDIEGNPEPDYKPILCLKEKGKWRVIPWASEKDLKAVYEQRSKEEQIHLKLFNKWANLMGEMLADEAAKANPPASKATSPVER